MVSQSMIEDRPEALVLHLLFGVGAYTFAVPLEAVNAVERPGRFTPLPYASPWLRGVMGLRGEVVSVVDLALFAGVERGGRSPGARLVVIDGGGVRSGLLVDRVGKLTALPREPGAPPAKDGPLAPWWRGAHAVDGETVPVLDVTRLLKSPQFQGYQIGG
jgi:purine-binding chemotaxis protein CheW